jgi:hypothetical protein
MIGLDLLTLPSIAAESPIILEAKGEAVLPIKYPVSPLTDIAANETANPEKSPKKAPHIALRRHDGIGRKISLANTPKRINATATALPLYSSRRLLIQQSILSPNKKKGIRTIAARIAHIANGFKFNIPVIAAIIP